MTAKELLSDNSNAPIVVAFRNSLGGKTATKRKAAEFLHNFGAQYGLHSRKRMVLPVVEKKPAEHKQRIDLSGSTAKILRSLIKKS